MPAAPDPHVTVRHITTEHSLEFPLRTLVAEVGTPPGLGQDGDLSWYLQER